VVALLSLKVQLAKNDRAYKHEFVSIVKISTVKTAILILINVNNVISATLSKRMENVNIATLKAKKAV
jgi:hypothetical protein